MRIILFILLLVSFSAKSQDVLLSTASLKADLEILIQKNTIKNLLDLSGNEAIRLRDSATAKQLLEITKPYLNSTNWNAKSLVLDLLGHTLLNPKERLAQKKEAVEVLCKNYLDKEWIQLVDNYLLLLNESYFNAAAKKYISALADPETTHYASINAQLLAMAQVREAIPALWKWVNTNIDTIYRDELDVYASLARLGDKKAAAILCKYYNSKIDRSNYRHVLIAKQLAFSLDKEVLYYLVNDFTTMDINWGWRDGDYGFHPAYNLASAISSMLKNYPYRKGDSSNPKELLAWLNSNKNHLLIDK